MNFIDIILISVGLAMDASAVSLVAASSGYAENARAKFRLSFHFGLFQFLMPIIGWGLGISFVSYFSHIDHWIDVTSEMDPTIFLFTGLKRAALERP